MFKIKRLASIILSTMAVTLISVNSFCQNSSWIEVINSQTNSKTVDGVSVYWSCKEEMKDQFRSSLRFENNNDFDVEVSFEPWFTCIDGTEPKIAAEMVTIKAHSFKSGEWQGLGYYPCDGKQPPKFGGYRWIKVSKAGTNSSNDVKQNQNSKSMNEISKSGPLRDAINQYQNEIELTSCSNGLKVTLTSNFITSCKSNVIDETGYFYDLEIKVYNYSNKEVLLKNFSFWWSARQEELATPANYISCIDGARPNANPQFDYKPILPGTLSLSKVRLGFSNETGLSSIINQLNHRFKLFCGSVGSAVGTSQFGSTAENGGLENLRRSALEFEQQGNYNAAYEAWVKIKDSAVAGSPLYTEASLKIRDIEKKLIINQNAKQQATNNAEEKARSGQLVAAAGLGILIYNGIGKYNDRNRFVSTSWRFNFNIGYSISSMPIYVNNDFRGLVSSISNRQEAENKVVNTFNLDLGLQFWPIYGKNYGLALIAEGSGGYLPLTGNNSAYTYGYGGQAFVGFPGFKFQGSYIRGDRGMNYNYTFNGAAGTSYYTASGAAKYSRIMFGPRFSFYVDDHNSVGHLDFNYITETYPNMENISTQGFNITYLAHHRLKIYGECLLNGARIGTIEYTLDSEVKNKGLYIRFGVLRTLDTFGGHN